jgi:hypothetical protein
MRKLLILMTLLFSTVLNLSAQRNCGQEQYHQHLMQTDPNYLNNQQQIEEFTNEFVRNYDGGSRAIVTIPVVFHVIYNTSTQNISDSKLNAQINQLNLDFSKLNSDNANTPSIFQPTGNMDIQFCLATRDPNGNATSGIQRRQTTVSAFSTNNAMKYFAQGGLDAWPSSSYLNIWICNMSGGILGYAQFPGGSAATDGVVLLYSSVGSVSNPSGGAFGLGRTGTHEVGHWLNLRHIWGDANCGSDLVSDTPTHNTSNYGCPTYPHLSTCTGTPVEMTMNFMDYTDDACMYMFSNGQAARSQALFTTGGARASLLNSLGCSSPNTSTCGVPTNTTSSNITTNSVVVSWSAVSGVTSYNLQYKLSTSTTWTTLNTTSNSVSITGLTSNSTYNYQVQSVCGTSNSLYSTQASFTTLQSSTTCTDVYESNNSLNQAKTIPVNTTVTARISTSTDKDYFKFTTTTSNRNIRIDLTNLPADYDVKLYNPSNTLVTTSANSGTTSEVIIYNNGPVGTYKVYVYGYSGAFNSTICYNLLASVSSSTFRSTSEEQLVFSSTGEFENLLAYPNPTDKIINLSFSTKDEESYQIIMIDAIGKQVYDRKYVSNSGNNQVEIDISELSIGCYNILLIGDNKRDNLRIIKK